MADNSPDIIYGVHPVQELLERRLHAV